METQNEIEKIIESELSKNNWVIYRHNGNWYPIGFVRDCIKSALLKEPNQSKICIDSSLKLEDAEISFDDNYPQEDFYVER